MSDPVPAPGDRLRLTYLCHEPLPSHHTSTEQLVQTAAALAQVGAEVLLSFPLPWVERHREGALQSDLARYYGIDPRRFDSGLRLAPRIAPRWVRGDAIRLWHALTAPARLVARDPAILYTRDPVPLAAALRTGRPVIFETYRLDFSQGRRYAAWRAYCYRHPGLLGMITHSRMARDAAVAAGVAADRVLVAHNGHGPGLLARSGVRAPTGLPEGRPLVVYAGHVASGKGLEAVLALAQRMPEVSFVVVGHVPGSSGHRWLETAIAAARIENLVAVARVDPAEVAGYLHAADVLLVPPSSRSSQDGRTVVPMKLFQYLAAGRPIVAPRLPDIEEVLVAERNAVLVPADDTDAAATAIHRLLSDPDRASALAAAAMVDARRYTWEARADRILGFVQSRLATS